MVQVRFESISTKNGFLPTESAQYPITIEWNGDSNQLYTVIFYDIDAPYPAPNNTSSPFLHSLIINIKGSDMSTGNQLIDYMSPHPPLDSLPHTYLVDVYLQRENIRPSQHSVREKFKLNEFIKDHNLTLLDRTSFKVGKKIPTRVSAMSIPISRQPETTNYFKADSNLDETQKSWCRCVLHVSAKQRGACNVEQAWFEKRNDQSCYNPYAVCSKRLGTSVRTCGENYDFPSISDDELIAYAQLHQKKEPKISIPDPYSREKMLDNIRKWKETSGKQ
jgi:phosphatidylethanolamine-binding protein (PEBP) family uncharacterized protein